MNQLTAPPAGAELQGKRVLITGGTGLIGSALVPFLLERGATVSVVTRDASRAQRRLAAKIEWLGPLATLPPDAQFDYLINLAGESLAQGRWTEAKKIRLFYSRLGTTGALLEWVRRAQNKPAYLISASAVGFYGHRGGEPLTESDAGRDSFGHRLCQAWEEKAEDFTRAGVAVTRLRLGVVFARAGGAFEQLCSSFHFKVATVMGEGSHYCSWVHMADLLRIMEFLLCRPEQQRLTGAVNATAPEPLAYAELAHQLAQKKQAILSLRLPASLLRLGLGEMADELLLHGQRVMPERLQQAGFAFLYPTFARALDDLL